MQHRTMQHHLPTVVALRLTAAVLLLAFVAHCTSSRLKDGNASSWRVPADPIKVWQTLVLVEDEEQLVDTLEKSLARDKAEWEKPQVATEEAW